MRSRVAAAPGVEAGTPHATGPVVAQAWNAHLWRSHLHTMGSAMPKGQQGKKKDNKPKLSTADKQKKKKEKEAKKK